MTMFMGILGQTVMFDQQIRENSSGRGDWPDDQDELSIYLGSDNMQSELVENLWLTHDHGHSFLATGSLLESDFEEVIHESRDLAELQRAAMSTIPSFPVTVESLICLFLRRDEQVAVIGDLVENYGKTYQRFGKRRADLYAYTEAVRSLYPFMKCAFLRTSVMILLGEWIRRLTS